MRRPTTRLLVLAALAALCLAGVTGCGKKEIETTPSVPAEPADRDPMRDVDEPDDEPRTDVRDRGFPGEDEPSREVLPDPRSAAEYDRLGVLRTIYFAFDSSELTPQARSTLQENATWLAAHPEFDVVVEGHCDERGTIEYNLSLGQRRARSVRDYLVNLGVERGRVRTVSYGEERPVARGHDESAWSQNRRAAFDLEDR